MDLVFLSYGLIAIGISVAVSTAELMSKYQTKSLKDIFSSKYSILFIFLNAICSFIVYLFLPSIGNLIIKPEVLSYMTDDLLIRAFISGIGYSLLIRIKLLDISYKGRIIGIGLEGLYDIFSEYILRHHKIEMDERIREEFFKMWDLTKNPCIYLGAVRFLMKQVNAKERSTIESKINNLKNGNPPAIDLCLGLYILAREYTPSQKDLDNLFKKIKDEFNRDENYAKSLKDELTWLDCKD